MNMRNIPALQIRKLRKEFPGTVALDDVSMTFTAGRIHALIGKNGAGKSTLVRILSGAIQPSSGDILLNGTKISMRSPAEAFARRISMVYQEMSLIPELSVAENIFLGRLPKKRRSGLCLIDWDALFGRARALLDRLNVRIEVKEKVSRLDLASQQIIEIAKAMSHEPNVLLLDEPTSALSYQGTESLFALMKELCAQGVVIIYITHRMQELKKIADEVSVLRDGSLVGYFPINEATPAVLARMMFGEDIQRSSPAERRGTGEKVLEVKNLRAGSSVRDISFSVEAGEVLGIAGMLGSGRTELLRALFGADPIDSGDILIRGRRIDRPEPAEMKKHGLGLIPEKRKEEGLIQILSVKDNLSLASLGRISRKGMINRAAENDLADRAIRDLRIAVTDMDREVSMLSGGNQQKVVIGKWLSTEPAVILFDEPTRGIDIHAKQQIFFLIRELSRKGVGCVLVSTELEELLEICHRIIVLNKGKITGEIPASAATMEKLFAECMKD